MSEVPSMSEHWVEQAQAADQPAVHDGVTAGALLRQAREASGLHVAALAVSLKVPVKKLEALEENRWDLLPDLVFVRALASSVCRTLKVDPQPIMERLPQTTAPRLVRVSDGINTPFRAPSDGAPPTWFDQMTKPVFLAVFALLLGALVLILLPSTQQEKDSAVAAASSTEAVAPPTPAVSPAPEPAPPIAQAPPAPQDQAAAPALPTPTAGVPTPAGMAPAATASAPISMTAGSVGAQAPTANSIVVFRTKGTSWVEVTDAKGVTALRKELQAGEAAGVSGVLPLQVTIGRVDHTEVQVRGKPFDLRAITRDNVARFEVK